MHAGPAIKGCQGDTDAMRTDARAAVPALPAEISAWCAAALGAAPVSLVLTAGHLGRVYGVELADGRAVAIKVRAPADRITACWAVQRHLADEGFPCPQPLAGPARIGPSIVTAEVLIRDARAVAPTPATLPTFAALLTRLVALAPPPQSCQPLGPPPPWVGWDHGEPGTWPMPDDLDCDLNDSHGPALVEAAGERLRARLRSVDLDQVVGHLDWEAHNLLWRDGQAAAVLDFDSIGVRPEAAIAGAAAAVYPSLGDNVAASIGQTEQYLAAYEAASGRVFSRTEHQVAWAAGAWVLAYNARKEAARTSRGPYQDLLAADGAERLRRAGA
jgi:Ser/Thr protein kinase RdoA (MazF antagonist)